jgi:hypothetical protein
MHFADKRDVLFGDDLENLVHDSIRPLPQLTSTDV